MWSSDRKGSICIKVAAAWRGEKNRKSQTSLPDWVEESRWKSDSFTPILALCSVRRSEELCDSPPLWTPSCLSVQTPYKHSLWLSLAAAEFFFFLFSSVFPFLYRFIEWEYATHQLDGCLYHYFQNKSPNPKKNTIELKFRNNKSKQVDRSISRV